MEEKIEIKKLKLKKKALRTRRKSSSDEDKCESEDALCSSKIEEMKIVQKSRERPRGVEIVGLALGQPVARDETKDTADHFKVKSGGMVNMKGLVVTQSDDAYDVGIGTQFSAETNKRDEDEEMMKYIEEQLTKKKSVESGPSGAEELTETTTYHSPEDAALQAVPDHLRSSSGMRSEEMLSNQMLSGIPEVDLGIECKIKNIEATEEAKLRLLWEQRNKKEGPSQFVPTNITVNFAQPTKINSEDELKKRPEKRPPPPPPEAEPSGSGKKGGKTAAERATDDFHYERFKKQFRRY